MTSRHVSIPVFGFACGAGGTLTVERVLSRIQGTITVYVNPATGLAEIDFDADRITVEELCRAIRHCGFRPGKPFVDEVRTTSSSLTQG